MYNCSSQEVAVSLSSWNGANEESVGYLKRKSSCRTCLAFGVMWNRCIKRIVIGDAVCLSVCLSVCVMEKPECSSASVVVEVKVEWLVDGR
jgi:hypothetical protein